MANKKQTALEWLKDQIIDNPDIYIEGNSLMIPNDIFRKSKQMEKEQIIDAHLIGLITSMEMEATKQAEQYYNETYNTETDGK